MCLDAYRRDPDRRSVFPRSARALSYHGIVSSKNHRVYSSIAKRHGRTGWFGFKGTFSPVHRSIVHREIIYRWRMTKHNLRVAKWSSVWSIVRVVVNVGSRIFRSCVSLCIYSVSRCSFLHSDSYICTSRATCNNIVTRIIPVSDS